MGSPRNAQDAILRALGVPMKAADALFGDRYSTEKESNGRVDRRVVDARMRETEGDLALAMDMASRTGDPSALAGAYPAAFMHWISNVRPGGAWDDKAHVRAEGEQKVREQRARERMGNFSYGATATVLGIPLEAARRGAGAAQRASNFAHALKGEKLTPSVGLLRWPYGDDPRDQRPIGDGYAYGTQQGARR